jgi:hypothetical protein
MGVTHPAKAAIRRGRAVASPPSATADGARGLQSLTKVISLNTVLRIGVLGARPKIRSILRGGLLPPDRAYPIQQVMLGSLLYLFPTLARDSPVGFVAVNLRRPVSLTRLAAEAR